MSYVERYDGPTFFLSDTRSQALLLHVDCGSTVWGDPLDDAWRYGGTGKPECPECGIDVRTERWTRLFVGEPVTVVRSEADGNSGTCRCSAQIEELDDGNGVTYWAHVKRMRMEYDHSAVPAKEEQ